MKLHEKKTLTKIVFRLLLCFWVVLPVLAQETVEERLDRIEVKLDRLIDLHNLREDASELPVELAENIHLDYGFPGCDGQLLTKQHFVICHRNDWKTSQWVAYHLSRENLRGDASRTNDFRPDPELPAGGRAELEDYRGSGYDRGHMAPAAAFKRSKAAMSETFFLSNMAPQTPSLNRRMWKYLEEDVRSLARAHGSIWVFTGNLFLDEEGNSVQPASFIGENDVVIPTHCFKAILCEHGDRVWEMFAFLMPNQSQRLAGAPEDYIVTVDRIEELTGLDFFSRLPNDEEDRLENLIGNNWPIEE